MSLEKYIENKSSLILILFFIEFERNKKNYVYGSKSENL